MDCSRTWQNRPKRVMQNYEDPHFFSFSFLILSNKNERANEKKVIRMNFLREDERSSGDNYSNSNDYDSNSDNDDLNFSDVLV